MSTMRVGLQPFRNTLSFPTLLLFLAFPIAASGLPGQEGSPQTEEQRQSRRLLNEGVQAFKNRQYAEIE
jgi:hypothetical protein